MSSVGGTLGTWSVTPQGCSRDAFDGLGQGQTRSVMTLLWQDPAAHDPHYHDHAREHAPDVPMRLDVMRDDGGLAALLETLHTHGTRLDGESCKRFALTAHEEPAAVEGGRPTLAGRLEMDCMVKGSHVSADLRFRRCEF